MTLLSFPSAHGPVVLSAILIATASGAAQEKKLPAAVAPTSSVTSARLTAQTATALKAAVASTSRTPASLTSSAVTVVSHPAKRAVVMQRDRAASSKPLAMPLSTHKTPTGVSDAELLPMHFDPSRAVEGRTGSGNSSTPAKAPRAENTFGSMGGGSTPETMHLTVGHVVFLNTKARIRRIYIANPAVLDSYTVSPNQIVLTAKIAGMSSVVIWNENDESQTYIVSSDVDVDELRTSLKRAFPDGSLQVEGRESKVLLSGSVGTDSLSDSAVKLATLYSKDVSNSLQINAARIKQVRLKVRIVEVDRSKLDQFGINLFNVGTGSTIGVGSTNQFPTSVSTTGAAGGTSATAGGTNLSVSDPLNFLFYSAKINLGLTVKDLENRQVLQILAEPNITTMSGQKASFLAGGEFPFPVVQGSAGGTATVTVQFRPYGVKLEFTPVVNPDGTIALKILPEVSALDFTNAVTISGYTIPALSTKRADTQVVLRSGQSFAISGLLDRRTTDAFSHTPGIANVPVLGQLFKSKGINLSTSELMVIVTPTVVDPLTEEGPLAEPAPVVPFMKTEPFDKTLPAAAKKH